MARSREQIRAWIGVQIKALIREWIRAQIREWIRVQIERESGCGSGHGVRARIRARIGALRERGGRGREMPILFL